ncbi:F-box protein CPR1-like [Papaver somniferum]|uniref:F-box protein CPR1-like n=1 Tax=Papaver somniferum TaxID=3469 RepID=UPI000E6F9DAE|nr:F-box protein CPR1-like [Papaver somniferum]
MATPASLPEDIIINILLKLSLKSIAQFKCVAKPWYEMVKNPKFIKMHRQRDVRNYKFSVLLESSKTNSYYDKDGCHYTIDFDVTSSTYHMAVQTYLPRNMFVLDSQLIDSCGLIGLSTRNPDRDILGMICLWNPSTQEYLNVPTPTSIRGKSKTLSQYGVCYDWKIHDYKLFLIVTKRYDEIFPEVWVSRLGSNIWKRIGNVPYDHSHVPDKNIYGIVHWIKHTKVIVSYDIVEERTRDEFQIPSCYLDDEWYSFYRMDVGFLGEDLYLSVNIIWYDCNIDLWVMKDYGVIDSWTKIFSISKTSTNFRSLRPLHYLNKDCDILLHGNVKYSYEDVLVSCDPKNGRLKTFDIPCKPKHFYPTTFVGSLVSFKSAEFVEATKTISKVDI